jgi:3-oxoacyl-ACP reductase-like protein
MELYARYLELDLRAGDRQYEKAHQELVALQQELDLWLAEHGEVYAQGIRPMFSELKVRRFDSYWNWVRQDALLLYFDIVFGRLTIVDRDVTAQSLHVMNRANPQLMDYMGFYIGRIKPEKGLTYKLCKELATTLLANCAEVLNESPVYKDGMHLMLC